MISEDVLSTEYLGQEKQVNKTNPVVSVCVITYNHAPYIRECLDSILMQETDFPFEIIIGEDNSSDGTREICIQYAAKYPDKVRLFLRKPDQKIEVNGEKTFHFNFIEVLKAARGEYIAFCEGDDYWTDLLKLQKQVDVLCIEREVAMLATKSRVEWIGGKVSYLPEIVADIYITHEEICTSHILGGNSATLMFRKLPFKFIEEFGVMKLPAGDWALCLMSSLNGKIKVLNDVTAVYRKHEGGAYAGLSAQERTLLQLNMYSAMIYISNLPESSKKILRESQLKFFERLTIQKRQVPFYKKVLRKLKLG